MKKNKPTKTSTSSIQSIIEIYKKDVDRSLIRENLKLTIEERLLNANRFIRFAYELRQAGTKQKHKK